MGLGEEGLTLREKESHFKAVCDAFREAGGTPLGAATPVSSPFPLCSWVAAPSQAPGEARASGKDLGSLHPRAPGPT